MKTQFTRKNALLAFGALTLLGAPLAAAPVQAQATGGAADNGKPISLNLINVPIQTALRTLFSSAGIRNYTIEPGVQGYANITVSDVPFSVALNQLLGSGNPPLDFSVVGGIYNIKLKTAAPAPAVNVAVPTDPNNPPAQVADQPKRFYSIPINSYDAYYIATLVGQTGIVEVVPNYPAGGQGNGAQGGTQGGFGQSGNRGGFGNSNVSSVGGFGGSSGGFGGGFGGGGYGGSTGGFGGGGFGGGFGR